jgi:hypothetical protein
MRLDSTLLIAVDRKRGDKLSRWRSLDANL